MVRRVASPYNVNAVALAVLPDALEDRDYVERYAAEVRLSRAVLEQELRQIGLQFGLDPESGLMPHPIDAA